MARKTAVWTVASLTVLSVGVMVWFGRPPTGTNEQVGLPGSMLSDARMKNIWGGRGIVIEPRY